MKSGWLMSRPAMKSNLICVFRGVVGEWILERLRIGQLRGTSTPGL